MTWRILVAGSPTGGHLYPGIALATALAEQCGCDPHFVTSGSALEERVLGATRFSTHTVPFGRRQLLGSARRQARALIAELQPDALVGLGGLGSVALAVAGVGRGLPLFLLEQNAVTGRANRWLAPLSRRVFTSFRETSGGRWLRRRAVALGCPVRAAFTPAPLPSVEDGQRPLLLVQGGSQGAEQINEMLTAAAALWATAESTRRGELRILHAAGPGKSGGIQAAYDAAGIEADVCEYLEDPAAALQQSAMVVGRAGGSSVAEITAVGRGALFVPYPHHSDRQQYLNADPVVQHGGAEVIDGTGAALVEALERNFFCAATRERMAERSRECGIPDAAERIATVIATHLERLPDDHPLVGVVV